MQRRGLKYSVGVIGLHRFCYIRLSTATVRCNDYGFLNILLLDEVVILCRCYILILNVVFLFFNILLSDEDVPRKIYVFFSNVKSKPIPQKSKDYPSEEQI